MPACSSNARYVFAPMCGQGTRAEYRAGAGSVVLIVARGEAPTRDMPLVRFPDGSERRVAYRDLLAL